jgi:hypothetical protein
MQVNEKRVHIKEMLATAMLWVFFLALTPWSSFHHHQEISYTCNHETSGSHKVHISSHAEQCLICSAHFEKTYSISHHFFSFYESPVLYIKNQPVQHALYSELISTSLRGPPVA